MAGNSSRRGAGHKGKSRTAGSGGRIRRSLEGRGPTPKAEDRPYHKAYKAKQAAQRRQASKPKRPTATGADWVVGRNPVYEAFLAGLPVKAAYVAEGADRDDRLRDILKFAAENSIPLLQTTRGDLDRLTGGLAHQGVALQLPAFDYADPLDLIDEAAADERDHGLIVALDGITDPRNLGAIVRSAAAFGATGIIIPSRRSATMTAAAWKTSAGAAARLPVAMATNLNRALERCAEAGFTIVGLAGEATQDISAVPGLTGPVVLVVGSEGDGLARLVREHCDHLAAIPIASTVESLNASVAAAIALYEIGRVRG
ncbi:MAG: 23S rRNA (guanosine(2251)-2'-O)-methyltransferase RlmB [Propionibacteriaceae bacterium]|nr:23S rRNA (guanosine(2251)-2'-O)-methyltransferase RlmB [Propionibacteriaceae bacterium]